jgi:hypothetical protein
MQHICTVVCFVPSGLVLAVLYIQSCLGPSCHGRFVLAVVLLSFLPGFPIKAVLLRLFQLSLAIAVLS